MASVNQLSSNPSINTQPRRSNLEYLLQGSVLDESVDVLLQRLRSMCDCSEEEPQTFRDHEIVFLIKDSNNSNQVNVRVRHSLINLDAPWTLLYLGNPELGDKNRPTMVRTCVEVSCTKNVCAFLQEMGFIMEFEYITTGWIFRKNRLKATVSKIHRLPNPSNLEQTVPISISHLVEVSTVAFVNEQVAQDIQNFSEQLKPLVNLEKIDHRRQNV